MVSLQSELIDKLKRLQISIQISSTLSLAKLKNKHTACPMYFDLHLNDSYESFSESVRAATESTYDSLTELQTFTFSVPLKMNQFHVLESVS